MKPEDVNVTTFLTDPVHSESKVCCYVSLAMPHVAGCTHDTQTMLDKEKSYA